MRGKFSATELYLEPPEYDFPLKQVGEIFRLFRLGLGKVKVYILLGPWDCCNWNKTLWT